MNEGVLITIIVTAMIFLIFAILTLLEELKYKRNARIIEGDIIRLNEDSDHSGKQPTVRYFDDMTNSYHTYRSDVAITHFKKVGDKYKLRVISKGDKRRHEMLFALHVHSFFGFLLFLICCWIIISYLNPYNDVSIVQGYNAFYQFTIIEVPFIILSFLLYLNQKLKISESD